MDNLRIRSFHFQRITIKILVLAFVMFMGDSLLSQKLENKPTSISLRYGSNLTFSTDPIGSSVGGLWGLEVDHYQTHNTFGFTTGISYSLINVGFEPFTPPSEADGYKLLDTSLGILYAPFNGMQSFRIRLGYAHSFIVDSSAFINDYNRGKAIIGFEHIFETLTNFHASFGVETLIYKLNEERHGQNITGQIFLKFGLKS